MRLQLVWWRKAARQVSIVPFVLGLAIICLIVARGPEASAAPSDKTAKKGSRPIHGEAEIRSSTYVDNDSTLVSTSAVDITIDPTAIPIKFSGGYAIDAVSSASVDVVSAATARFDETRNQYRGGISWLDGDWSASGSYTYSSENDWASHSASASVARDFLQKNVNLALGYSFVDNDIRRADDDGFQRTLRSHAVDVGWTQVLARRAIMRLNLFMLRNDGMQSSPYRYVPVGGPPLGRPHPELGLCVLAVSCPRERHPQSRTRFGARWTGMLHIGKKIPASLELGYRYYFDDWELQSHTLKLAARVEFARLWIVRLESRSYFQTGTFFYSSHYRRARRYLSLDRELSRFLHQLAGLKLTRRIPLSRSGVELRTDAKVDLFIFEFFDFEPLKRRIGGVFELGLGARY